MIAKHTLMQATTDILKKGILEKMAQPRSFTVHCLIGKMDLGRALCNLGLSINLMTFFIFQKLELSELQPTYMRLLFVDRLIAKPEGKLEDVLVKVAKFLFPADFIILDYLAN